MTNFTKILILLTLFATLPAQAVVIDGKDWLQVTATTGNSWSDIDALFETDGTCSTASCLLNTTDLSDYVWASNTDVNNLFTSFLPGFDISSSFYNAGTGGLDTFFNSDNFDPTFSVTGSFNIIAGLTRDASVDLWVAQQFVGADDGSADSVFQNSILDTRLEAGWFYKSTSQSTPMPEPSIIALFGLGIAGIGFIRRRKSHQ